MYAGRDDCTKEMVSMEEGEEIHISYEETNARRHNGYGQTRLYSN